MIRLGKDAPRPTVRGHMSLMVLCWFTQVNNLAALAGSDSEDDVDGDIFECEQAEGAADRGAIRLSSTTSSAPDEPVFVNPLHSTCETGAAHKTHTHT